MPEARGRNNGVLFRWQDFTPLEWYSKPAVIFRRGS